MSLLEGIRNFANKKITTVATGAVLLSTNACDKPKEQTIPEDNKNKTEITNDPEFYRQQYIDYMKHPSYKERLGKEMYGNKEVNEWVVNKEAKRRIKQVNKIPINIVSANTSARDYGYDWKNNKLDITKPEEIPHELSHSLEHPRSPGRVMYGNLNPEQGFEDIKNSLIDREKIRSIIIENRKKELGELFKDYPEILIEDETNYYISNTEIKARLNELRIRALIEFNFNLNDEFDINKFEKLKKDPQYKVLRDTLHLTDEEINELMKYTAFNNPKNTFYPHGSDEEKFKKGYHLPGLDYGEEEDQA